MVIAVNTLMLLYYVFQDAEPGKILYWLGSVILTFGVFIMRG